MTTSRVSFVDVYPVRSGPLGLETLVLRRSVHGRCTGAWEAVHGSIEPGERPVEAALRELREETGLKPARLYNLSRTEMFYRHAADEVALIPVFVAFTEPEDVRLSTEHDASEWLSIAEAGQRLAWPRERRALEDIGFIFAAGHAGPLEDVLRIER